MAAKTTRRQFLGTAGAAAAAGWLGGRLYAADNATGTGPNETINFGVIGCGARGGQVLSRFRALPGNRVVAVCDVHSAHMANMRKACGGDQVAAYADYRKLLDDKNVDVVLIATQAHWHPLITIRACQAGKDVYVEKPLGNSIHEGRVTVDAVRKYGRIVQFGTQQRSWDQYRKAVEVIQSGAIGDISEVKVWDYENVSPGIGSPADCDPPKELDWDFYLGPAPLRKYNPNVYYNYGYDWFTCSGAGHQVAWGVHHFDIVNWAMDVQTPISAVATGGKYAFPKDNREWPDTFDGLVEYGPGPVAKNGFVLQYTLRLGCRREFRAHAKCFFGSKGSLLLDRSGYTITSEEGGPRDNRQKLIKEDSYRSDEDNHQEVFLQNVRRRTPPFSSVEHGHYATNVGHLLNISWLVGRKIRWDGQKEQVLDDAEANALVDKPYREPWKLEI